MLKKIIVCLFLSLFCANIGVINAKEKFSKGEASKKLTQDEKRSRWVTIFSIRAAVGQFVLNPRDSNLIYALASPYGLFETRDGGKSWEPVWKTFPLWSTAAGEYEVMRRIVRFDPLNPHIIYIAVSIAQREDVVSMTPRKPKVKLLRSKDSGRSWEDITGIFQASVILDVAIDPKLPEIIYVATSDGLFKTLNGGKSWGKIWDKKGVSQVVLNPEVSNEVMILANLELYYSKDGGENFSNITPVIQVKNRYVTDEEPKKVFYATFNPHDSRELFAIGKGWNATEILKSTDKGKSWQVVSQRSYERHPLSPPIVKKLVFHPADRGVIYTIEESKEGKNDQILKSTDGGKTWIPLSIPFSTKITDIAKLYTYSPRYLEYVKISDIAIPRSDILYLATNYGVYKSIDGGESWKLFGLGLPLSRGKLLNIDPRTNSIYVGDNLGSSESLGGYWISSDGGLTWEWHFGPEKKDKEDKTSEVYQTVMTLEGTTYIVSKTGRVFKITPDGKHSELKLPFKLSYIRGVPSNSQILYAIAVESVLGVRSYRGSLFKTEDGGFSWIEVPTTEKKQISELVDRKSQRGWGNVRWYSIDLLAVDPQFPNTFYIKVGPGDSSNCVVLKTRDGGNSWTDMTDILGFVPESIIINPFNSNIIYASDGFKLFRSDNGGETWKSIKPPVELSINDIGIDLLNPKLLFLATNKGVYRSLDSGKTWQLLNDGLLETNIQKVMVSSGMVLVKGEKTGIYKLTK